MGKKKNLNVKKSRLIVVSNRSPYFFESYKDGIRMTRSVSGMVTGLEPVLASTRGMWIAWGALPKEVTDRIFRIPPENPTFDLKLIQLDANEINRYYLGFSNSTLWPLAHNFLGRTVYEEQNWHVYEQVNDKFAQAVAEEIRSKDTIWVNDYQLSLVPGKMRALGVRGKIGFFWHIPFPPLDLFRTLPWRKEIISGLLGSDLVGFHCRSYANNFLQAVEELLGLDVSFSKGLIRTRRPVQVAAFPMGIDYKRIQSLIKSNNAIDTARKIRKELAAKHLVLGVDRLDYSKGIPERLAAVERFLEENPAYIGKLSFIQVSVPSRIQLPEYAKMQSEVENAVGRINGRFSKRGWVPIHYYFRALPFEELVSYYMASDVCLITPLRDGMNLVAKEYIASQNRNRGMLVLSEFAGAAEELKEAVLVNPYSIPSIVRGLKKALEMKPGERYFRMNEMHQRLKRRDIEKWGRLFLEKLSRQIETKPVKRRP